MMDLIDNVIGPLNYLSRLTGWAQIQLRKGSKKPQKYGRTETVRVRIPWCDRANVATCLTIERHMKKHGVTLYALTHDANAWYCDVAKNQYSWFLKLYNGGQLWSPQTAWADNAKNWWEKWL